MAVTGASISPRALLSCHNSCTGALVASVSGSPGGTLTYEWSFNGGAYSAPSTNNTLNSACSGDYILKVFDDAILVATSGTYTLANPAAMVPTFSIGSISCNGGNDGSIALTNVTGGNIPITLSLTSTVTGASYNASYIGSPIEVDDLYYGDYNYILTDNKFGCTVAGTVTITQPIVIVPHPTIVNNTCTTGNSGSISLAPSGGTPFIGPTYHYLWSNGATTSSISSLYSGSYSVVISDGNGCVSNNTYNVSGGAALTIDATITGTTIGSQNSGIIINNIIGGTAPYTYLWNTNATTRDLHNLVAGTYSVVVTDANGCTGTASFLVRIECDNFTYSEFKVFLMKMQCCFAKKVKQHNKLILQGREDLANCLLSNLQYLRMMIDRFYCIENIVTDVCWSCDNIQNLMDIGKKICECDCCEEEIEGKVQVTWNETTQLFDIRNQSNEN